MPMELGIIIAITGTGVAVVAAVLSMMFWCRGEANALRVDAKEDRRELIQISRNIEMEMRDFHYRLLEIERSRIKVQS